MSHIESIKQKMTAIADQHKLESTQLENFHIDLAQIARYDGLTIVWLLRKNGTNLVPTKIGVAPTYVTHWLWGSDRLDVIPFKIDTLSGEVERIDHDTAEKLIMALPCNLTLLTSIEDHKVMVNKVLENGCVMRIWGIFDSPTSIESVGNWQQWQDYFRSINNWLMAGFMGRAIRLLEAHKS